MIKFDSWQPDMYLLNAQAAADIKGVLPGPDGYLPWPMPVQVSAALPAVCAGGYNALATDGSRAIYAGTTATLKKFTDVTTWTDVSRLVGGAYNVAVTSDHIWSLDQFGHYLLATNVNDVVQFIDVDVGANFAALSGSPPQARWVKAFGDFVMLFGISSLPTRLQWCGRNDMTFWTAGSRDSDIQDFPDGGHVKGIAPFGLGRGLLFQDNAIRAIIPVDDRRIFTFSLVEDHRGLLAPSSLVVSGGVALYLSQDGFYATDGNGQSRAIGVDIVDAWFKSVVELTRISAVRGVADPIRNRVFWAFPSSGNTSAIFDMVLCYDLTTNRWSYTDALTVSALFQASTLGYTADNIDTYLTALGYTIETAPFSFDAAFLAGGSPILGVFDSSFKLAFLNGSALAASLETGDIQLIPGMRTFIRGVRPLTDTTAATVTVGSKEAAQGSVTYGSASALNTQGMARMRSSGVYHRIKVAIPSATAWTHIRGVELDRDAVPAGRR